MDKPLPFAAEELPEVIETLRGGSGHLTEFWAARLAATLEALSARLPGEGEATLTQQWDTVLLWMDAWCKIPPPEQAREQLYRILLDGAALRSRSVAPPEPSEAKLNRWTLEQVVGAERVAAQHGIIQVGMYSAASQFLGELDAVEGKYKPAAKVFVDLRQRITAGGSDGNPMPSPLSSGASAKEGEG